MSHLEYFWRFRLCENISLHLFVYLVAFVTIAFVCENAVALATVCTARTVIGLLTVIFLLFFFMNYVFVIH